MIKDQKSFNAQVGIRTNLLHRFWSLLLLSFVFIINSLSAQSAIPNQKTDNQPLISVVGEAVLYSKDAAFNEQIHNDKNTQLHSTVEVDQNNNLIISAKKIDIKSEVKIQPKKKTESIVSESNKKQLSKSETLPKKKIDIHIASKNESSEFLLSSHNSHISFIPPNNDSSLSKYFIGYHLFQERTSVKFSTVINYYYKNRNFKQQISIHKFSVRPPPALFL